MKGDKKIIYLVGMGPGNFDMMTDQAIQAVEKSDVIVGYTVYVDLVKDHFPDKEFKTTPMRKEIERAHGKRRTISSRSVICSFSQSPNTTISLYFDTQS